MAFPKKPAPIVPELGYIIRNGISGTKLIEPLATIV